MNYEATATALRDRILALIPEHPGILNMTDCWDLFSVQGFQCEDLKPSMAQAAAALRAAQTKYRETVD